MDYMKIYQQWCSDPYFDDATKAELKAIENNKEEIEDRFYRQLEFGTGGLRGVIGRNKSHEHLYRASGNTGTCKLCPEPERTGKGCGNRI